MMFLIFNADGQYVGSSDYALNLEDLANRGEQAVKFTGEFTDTPILINGKLQFIANQPSPFHELVGAKWVLSETKHAEHLAQQIAQIRQAINAKRDECVNGGVYVPLIDKWVDTNEQGRSTLVEIKADFDLNGHDHQYTLICADNRAVPLDFTAFKAVWDAVKTLKEKMFENAYMHKILLETSDNPQAYDWSIGWAETYAEYVAKHTEAENE